MRTISWTGLSGQPEPLPAAPDRIVHRPAVLVEGLEPVLPVPADVLRELRDEGLGGEPAPVPAVEELDLQPPEEALAGGVVRRVALPRHGPRDPGRLARLHPVRGPVVPAAVGVQREAAADGGHGARQHLRDERLGGRRAAGERHDVAVVEIHAGLR